MTTTLSWLRTSAFVPVAMSALLFTSSGCASKKNDKNTPIAADTAFGETKNSQSMQESQDPDEITLPSGLKIKYLVRNEKGAMPALGDKVAVHYVGTLLDGKKFDSSRDRGHPFEFPLGQGRVIRGWDEGIAKLRLGEKAILTIPAELGYGPQGQGSIPPNSTLIFEVELMGIKPGPKPQTPVPFDIAGVKAKDGKNGLKYYVIKANPSGTPVTAGKKVAVHYTGYLTNGKKFDSSVERGEPIELTVGVGQVIKGWDEGLQNLRQGEKARLVIPSALAYGEAGAGGGLIPPNADLVFDVEIVEVN